MELANGYVRIYGTNVQHFVKLCGIKVPLVLRVASHLTYQRTILCLADKRGGAE
jgi:hypothetical protein